MPKDALFTPLPDFLKDWEVMEVSYEDNKIGCNNNEPLGNKKLVVTEGTKQFGKDLEKRGWDLVEVPYQTIYKYIGSGIHCST